MSRPKNDYARMKRLMAHPSFRRAAAASLDDDRERWPDLDSDDAARALAASMVEKYDYEGNPFRRTFTEYMDGYQRDISYERAADNAAARNFDERAY